MFYRAFFIMLIAGSIILPAEQVSAQVSVIPEFKQTGIPSESAQPTDNIEQTNDPLEEPGEEKLSPIPVIFNTQVENYIEYFTTRGNGIFQRWLNLSARYAPLIRDILREHNLPEDLVYVAMIESGFRLDVVSRKKAVGLWQIMPATGIRYGLRIDHWVDERKDPVKSTVAAARNLKDLYSHFKSWPLVLAAYNAGAGNVRRAVLRTSSTDFWDLHASPYFWKETRNFVPKFMAAVIIARNPEAYGFTAPDTRPVRFSMVMVGKNTDLRQIARQARCTYKEIRTLNPEIEQSVTPPYPARYAVRIPQGRKTIFLANERTILLARLPPRGMLSVIPYTIPDVHNPETRHLASAKEFIIPPAAIVASRDKAILSTRLSKRTRRFRDDVR